jgi:hypothetical protein
MKINIIMLGIAFAIAALAGYGFYSANGAEGDIPLASALGSGIALFVTLSGIIAIGTKTNSGAAPNIRWVSVVFFVLVLIEQIVFTVIKFRLPPYIVVTGILTLVYLFIAYAIGKALQNG